MYRRSLVGYMVLCGFVAIAVTSLPACNVFRRGGRVDPAAPGRVLAQEDEERLSGATQKEQLRAAVASHMARSSSVDGPADAPLVRRAPYFLREYARYPNEAAEMDMDIRETESRLAPHVADVTLPKRRYATQMHRRRDAAREDTNFFRETGEETLTYQWRNGRWVQVASLFVVDVKEQRVNGEWREVEPELDEDPFMREPEPGFFGRMFGSIFGRR